MEQLKVSCAPESVFEVLQGFALRVDATYLALNALTLPLEEKGELYGEAHLVELLAKELDELNTDLADYGSYIRTALESQQKMDR